MRILNAMVDIAADEGLLDLALGCMNLAQCVSSGRYFDDSPFLQLPGVTADHVAILKNKNIRTLQEMRSSSGRLGSLLRMKPGAVKGIQAGLGKLPVIDLTWTVTEDKGEGKAEGEEGGEERGEERGEEGGIRVSCDADCTVNIEITVGGRRGGGGGPARKGGKKEIIGWWLVLGVAGEVLALKRITLPPGTTRRESLSFGADEEPGESTMELHLVSDCTSGLDQQHSIVLDVRQP